MYNTVNKARGPLNTAMKGYNTLQQARAKHGQAAQDTAEDAQDDSPINIEDREGSNEAEKRANGQVAPSDHSPEPASKKRKSQDGSPVDDQVTENAGKEVNSAVENTENAGENARNATEDAQNDEDSLMVQSPNPIEDQTENVRDEDNNDASNAESNQEENQDGNQEEQPG